MMSKKEITWADVASFLLAEIHDNDEALLYMERELDGRGCCDLMIQRTAPDELSPQMIIHDLTALKVNKLPAMQRSIDAAIRIIKESTVV